MSTRVVGQRIVVESVEGKRLLVQEILIDCVGCGVTTIRILGHHVRAVHALLAETIAAEPDLCGEVGQREDIQMRLDAEQAKKGRMN